MNIYGYSRGSRMTKPNVYAHVDGGRKFFEPASEMARRNLVRKGKGIPSGSVVPAQHRRPRPSDRPRPGSSPATTSQSVTNRITRVSAHDMSRRVEGVRVCRWWCNLPLCICKTSAHINCAPGPRVGNAIIVGVILANVTAPVEDGRNENV